MMNRTHGFNNKFTEIENKRLFKQEISWKSRGWRNVYLCIFPFQFMDNKNQSSYLLACLLLTWQLQLYSKYNNKINVKGIFVPFCFTTLFGVTTSGSLKPFPRENYLKLQSGCLCRLSSCKQDRQSDLASSFILEYYLIWKSETGKGLLLTYLTYFWSNSMLLSNF